MPRQTKPDHYIACPNCSQELRVRYPFRGYEKIQWSDNFLGTEANGFCEFSSCPVCAHPFWIGDVAKLDRIAHPTPRDSAFGSAILMATGWHGVSVPFDERNLPEHGELFVQPASNAQIVAALNQPALSSYRQLLLRKTLWHNINHPQRGFSTDPSDVVPESIRLANLQWLQQHYENLPLVDRDVVIEAELLREQGLFAASIERMHHAIRFSASRALAIKREIDSGNIRVFVISEVSRMVVY